MTSKIADVQVQMIPLNRLKKSPRNVRQMPHTAAHIEALAASIAAQGQIQNLVVETERDGEGKETGHFLVNVGEGRRQACLLRVKRKEIKASEPVRCVVDDTHDPQALSLAENDIRSAMHPADQFAAFQRLVDSGLSVESVAAQFSVSTLVVARRLKLANVAPAFLARYRADEVSLEQLMALALTDDHERQQSVWDGLPAYRRSPEGIRQALTESELSTRSLMVRFVGLKAYEKAGGAVRRDLFSEEGEGFVLDAALLWKLANAILEKQAAKVKAEGWAWVDVVPEADYSTLAEFGRVQWTRREATDAERAELSRLDQQLVDTQRELDAAEDERVDFLEQQIEEIEENIEAINADRAVPDPEQTAVAGALVCIDRGGRVKVETGLLRPEVARRFRNSAKSDRDGRSADDRVHSAALVRRLTAHRTAALAATIAQRPDVALLTLVHRLAVLTFSESGRWETAGVQIDLRRSDAAANGEDVRAARAQQVLESLEARWA